MDVELLERIVSLMALHDLNTVDVRDGQRRVILKRGAPQMPVQMIGAQPVLGATSAPAAPTSPAGALPSNPDRASEEESKLLRITSPMVGTFYASPKPGEKPFVTTGSQVVEDTDICIIEAMKTFNNIKAECRGVIAKALVQDGQPVEFGTVLFLVKPT